MKFTIFDLINIFVFGSSVAFSIINGFTKTMLNMVFFLLSFVLTVKLYPHIFSYANLHIENGVAGVISSGFLAYVFSLFISYVLKLYFLKVTAGFSGSIIDRAFGVLLGILRGILLIIPIFWVVTIGSNKKLPKIENFTDILEMFSEDSYPNWLKESETFGFLNTSSKFIIRLLPEENLNNYFSKAGFKKLFDDNEKPIIEEESGVLQETDIENIIEDPNNFNEEERAKEVLDEPLNEKVE